MSREQSRFDAIKTKSWQRLPTEPTDTTPPVPCMLTAEEAGMLRCVASLFACEGLPICDLGSFAGGSAYHLASGVRKALPNGQTKVHAYDFFEIPEDRKAHMLYRHGFPKFAGTDFLPSVQSLLTSINDLLVYHKGDFLASRWTGGRISVLHVDISKSYALNTHILNEFATALVPGLSLVIQQDYQHWANPWVAASMEFLEDFFELLSWTDENSVLFSCRKSLPPGIGNEVERAVRDEKTMRHLLRSAAKRFPDRRQREALAKSLIAYETNLGIERAWQFKLGSTQGRDFLAEAGID
jgi:hypothetical protein